MDAPVDRLLPFVDEALLDELPEGAHDGGLVLEVHREVQVVPVAEDAQTLELDTHHVDEARGVRPAGTAEVGDRHLALFRAELAIDFQLDGQTVAVVPEDVGRVEPHHRA